MLSYSHALFLSRQNFPLGRCAQFMFNQRRHSYKWIITISQIICTGIRTAINERKYRLHHHPSAIYNGPNSWTLLLARRKILSVPSIIQSMFHTSSLLCRDIIVVAHPSSVPSFHSPFAQSSSPYSPMFIIRRIHHNLASHLFLFAFLTLDRSCRRNHTESPNIAIVLQIQTYRFICGGSSRMTEPCASTFAYYAPVLLFSHRYTHSLLWTVWTICAMLFHSLN